MNTRQLLINFKLRITAMLIVGYLIGFFVLWSIIPLRAAIYNDGFTISEPAFEIELVYLGATIYALMVIGMAYFWSLKRFKHILLRIDETCSRLVKGEQDSRFRFRRYKEFGEFSDQFNEVVDACQWRRRRALESLRQLDEVISTDTQPPSRQALEKWLASVEAPEQRELA